MRHFATPRLRFFPKSVNRILSFMLGLGITITTISYGTTLRAASPEQAPSELKALISQIEAAANRRDIQQVMGFYSPAFSNGDGLTHKTLNQSLKAFWERYPDLKYTTELLSWEKVGDELIAETKTRIEGTSKTPNRTIQLNSTITSRQHFKGEKLVRQDILTEKTELTTGANPPRVEVVLPETVRAGTEFDFDVILQEPLGDTILAGAAIDETAQGDRYLTPGTLELELLQSGGLFKRAKASDKAENHWLSAILVREDGITLVTQRLRVEK